MPLLSVLFPVGAFAFLPRCGLAYQPTWGGALSPPPPNPNPRFPPTFGQYSVHPKTARLSWLRSLAPAPLLATLLGPLSSLLVN